MNIKNVIHLKWVGRFMGCKKVWASLVVVNNVNIHVGTHSPILPVTIPVYIL